MVHIDHEKCVRCGSCANACPVGAISMEQVQTPRGMDVSSYSGVWVIMENDENSELPKRVSYELLSKARTLADQMGEDVWAVDLCVGADGQVFDMLEHIGVDHLLLLEHRAFKQYSTELFADKITELIEKYRPSIVLFPGTENGRDLAPRISARLKVGLTADCTGLEVNAAKELVQIRPTYGGNIIASIVTPNHRPQMASVRPNVFRIVKCGEKKTLDVLRPEIEVDTTSLKIRRVGFTAKKTVYKDIEEASFVLIGGYGVGKEGVKLMRELAEKLGAAVGVTRKVVDEGWAPIELQIGQTGKTIAPDICICFGVSGSLQHTIGIKQAKRIIAVNHDPTAQIFSMSDVAILGDCRQILGHLMKRTGAVGMF